VTAKVALHVAERYRAKLVLLGRSPAPQPESDATKHIEEEGELKRALLEEAGETLAPAELETRYRALRANRDIVQTLDRLRAAGAHCAYHAVDIRNAPDVKRVIDSVQEQWGTVTALFHGAGVLADKRIEEKTGEQFAAVYDTKVSGLQNLLAAVDPNALNALVMFSSSTARFGRTGQADYALANEVLNKTAQAFAIQHPRCRTLSMNWGPWDGGMVTPSLRNVFLNEGVGLIELEAGAKFLLDELDATGDRPVEVVAMGGVTPPEVLDPGSAPDHALQTAFVLDLNVEAYPFLRSHVLDGKAVLPMAMYVEWFAQGALHGNPGLRFAGLNGLRILKGVILEEGETRPIRILTGKARRKGDLHLLPVELWARNGEGDVRYAYAEAVLSAKLKASTPRIEDLPLEPYERSRDEIYGDGLLFHGEALHGIDDVEEYSTAGMVAVVKTAPRPAKWLELPLRKSWIVDPLVLDCAFQMMVLWTLETHGKGSLPVFLGKYEQFQTTIPKGKVKVIVKVTEENAHRALADIEFINPQNGKLIARIDNYECVIDATLNAAFERNRLVPRAARR